ncbi:Lrp/AsnC family transcriptional regulator [Achromobacter pestifer]|uniref:Lrp/AsnC family transcriptional regulator n=1 Tax=Achromobacter pestifer TaxID=1353889 RepID=A0A7D4I7D9_9BURK|nr:Lrp/AsnC family transcriptional regulator [Achromobacter pestifer]QKH35381.1 Lrp/AsnC family transcriptional regulator [Achromobacter pestifer]
MELDEISWRLLGELQQDGRASLKVLAEAAGLSVAATAERLRKLQDAGIVRGITAEIDSAKAGYPVKAIVGVTVVQPGKKALLQKIRASPEVLECHHVAGADSYLMTVVATSLTDLERFIGTINPFGETRTSIVFSTPINRRGLVHAGSIKRS